MIVPSDTRLSNILLDVVEESEEPPSSSAKLSVLDVVESV